jgi:hypothetical protein
MELLLNLAWLLLALPACWLWRRQTTHQFSSRQCVLTLICTLVILFPVVSATDDLRAMRADMEESPIGKKTLRQSNGDKASSWHWQSPAAVAGSPVLPVPCDQARPPMPAPSWLIPCAPTIDRTGRAPPRFVLS